VALSRHQVEILNQCREERPIGDLMEIAKRTDRNKFRNQVLNPLLNLLNAGFRDIDERFFDSVDSFTSVYGEET
jgi:hypothetical protein